MKETKKYPKNENDRKVIEAFYELNSIVSTMSIGEMKEHYYKTTDQIALEKTEAKKNNELKKKKKQKDDDKDKFNSSVENHKDLVTITPTSSSTIKQKYYNLTSIAICSFTVEKFGPQNLETLTEEKIQQRLRAFDQLTKFEIDLA